MPLLSQARCAPIAAAHCSQEVHAAAETAARLATEQHSWQWARTLRPEHRLFIFHFQVSIIFSPKFIRLHLVLVHGGVQVVARAVELHRQRLPCGRRLQLRAHPGHQIRHQRFLERRWLQAQDLHRAPSLPPHALPSNALTTYLHQASTGGPSAAFRACICGARSQDCSRPQTAGVGLTLVAKV